MKFPAVFAEMVVPVFSEMGRMIHQNARAHGWWDDGERNDGEMIALMHSELSEALEALRKDAVDSHCPDFKGIEVELADVIIRILDYAHSRGLRIGEALVAKHAYNVERPYKHGNKRF